MQLLQLLLLHAPRRTRQRAPRLLRLGERNRIANRLRRSYHTHPDEHCRDLPERTLSAQEQSDGDASLTIKAARFGRARESGEARRPARRRKSERVGQPRPLVYLSALYANQRPPNRTRNRRRHRSNERGYRSISTGLFEMDANKRQIAYFL